MGSSLLKTVLLDTHVWAWSLTADPRLSKRALAAMARAETVALSPISFFEISQKVRLGKWPEMVPFVTQLPALLDQQGGSILSLDPAICVAAAMMDWPHGDPFNRLLAATAAHHNVAIISADPVFDEVVTRVW